MRPWHPGSPEVLSLYTIYDHPRDYPGHYVVRRFELEHPTSDVRLASTLEEARAPLRERGLVCLAREAGDDPVIVETWV